MCNSVNFPVFGYGIVVSISQQHWRQNNNDEYLGKGKSIDFTSPRTSSGRASRPYEMVPIGTILSPSEGGRKPQGENHQALAVKGERHPTCGLELNPGRSNERRTCYHGILLNMQLSLCLPGKGPLV